MLPIKTNGSMPITKINNEVIFICVIKKQIHTVSNISEHKVKKLVEKIKLNLFTLLSIKLI